MLKKTLCAVLFAFSTIPVLGLPAQASSCRFFDNGYSLSSNCEFPNRGGVFRNGEWEISIARAQSEGFGYMYKGRNRRTGDSLFLETSEVIGTTSRMQYIFRNGNYRYTVTIRPSEPNVIRLEVYQGNRVLLNQLLSCVGNLESAYQRIFSP
ncbi:MAG: hypothetical protein VKJ86_05395 [Synechococcus sp.]|nr:hypothetical protein [Synechococcus sp.]